jgi:hypothetical protein
MTEMPWKRKEKEMDKEFKVLVLNVLMVIMLALSDLKVSDNTKYGLYEAVKDVTEHIRKLG